MTEKKVNLYLDLTGILKSRINTGIQRVLKEFLQRTVEYASAGNLYYYFIEYNIKTQKYNVYSVLEIREFLSDIQSYSFNDPQEIDLFEKKQTEIAIFFDMDSVWNIHPKRIHLYPELKQYNFYIVNFLYDLSPILLPQYSHENTCRNFVSFLSAVYSYTDMVYFDSVSAEQDFLNIKKQLQLKREIPTRVTGLGSDFTQKSADSLVTEYQPLLEKKYILFVGTIEPRKGQEIVLNAFEELAKKYPDLNLIFIGKQGWKVEKFISRINNHALINKQFFYLDNINDEELALFYKNAWIVIYLSKHEGYGLPIAESLRYNNITIASKNSSMYEVGKNFADYIVYNSENEIIDNISLYYDNLRLYQEKKQYITDNFVADSWDNISFLINDMFQLFPESIEIKKSIEIEELQFVFISINIDILKETIAEIDKYIDFVKEYIVVTSTEKLNSAYSIKSDKSIIVVDENSILNEYSSGFSTRDHVQKNWLIRASLLNIEVLEENFIMLDDDNRPIKKIELSYFISPEGRYNAYYFYDLLNWHSTTTDYDKGQGNLQQVLSEKNYELLSYSSHAPQIINKKFFAEAIEEFFQVGLDKAIDEWSIYFNYSISKYPYLFNKKIFETLNWPALPTDWKYQYIPEDYSFENYYPSVYVQDKSELNGLRYFTDSNDTKEKLEIKCRQYQPHHATYEIFKEYQQYLAFKNEIYGCIQFETPQLSCYLFSAPKHLITITSAQFRLTMNCKIINKSGSAQKIGIYYLCSGKEGHTITVSVPDKTYYETIVELPISTYGMRRKNYNIQIDIKCKHQPVYGKKSPYKIKLSNYVTLAQVRSVKQLMRTDDKKAVIDPVLIYDIQSYIRAIPYLGPIVRKGYRMLRGAPK